MIWKGSSQIIFVKQATLFSFYSFITPVTMKTTTLYHENKHSYVLLGISKSIVMFLFYKYILIDMYD